MSVKKPKKNRKPVKYKTITIKVSARQKRSLVNYCLLRRTTPNKLIKRAIKPMLENYSEVKVNVTRQEKHSQLQLF